MPNSATQRTAQRPLHAPRAGDPQVIQQPAERETTGWVVWVWFAAALMVMVGMFDIIAGLVAVFDDNYLVGAAGKLFVVDATAWGWTTIVIGALVVAAALAVMRGAVWGRAVAVVMATLNSVVQMSTIRAYPIWALLVIMLNVFVIYALIVHGGELRDE